MSESEKKIIKVEIYGKSFKMRSSENEQYIQATASRVDELMNSIGRGKLTISDCAVFAAMTLADELNKAEDKLAVFQSLQNNLLKKLDGVFDEEKNRDSSDVSREDSDNGCEEDFNSSDEDCPDIEMSECASAEDSSDSEAVEEGEEIPKTDEGQASDSEDNNN